MDRRVPYSLGSAILLVGAFAVGWVFHQVLVQGAMSFTAPAAVFGLVGGGALILAGRAMERRFDPSDYVTAPERDEEEEFDEETAPLSEADLEGYERDESYE